VSLVFAGTNVGTLGASAAHAKTYDEMQFTYGEGPCLDAVSRRALIVAADLADPTETRWPAYGAAMLAQQIRSVHALPIAVAGHAQLAQIPMLDLLNSDLHSSATPGSDAWRELDTLTRAEVSQATGMLMAQLGLDAPAALVRIRAHAYATGRSATDVARDIVDHRLKLEPN
jgi:hypothetical protein